MDYLLHPLTPEPPEHAVLLLLPEVPSLSLRALYAQPLRAALRKAADNNSSPILDIAVFLHASRQEPVQLPRVRNHAHLQKLLALIYGLLGQLSLESDGDAGEIDITAPTGVDAHVFFVVPPQNYQHNPAYSHSHSQTNGDLSRIGFGGLFNLSMDQGPIIKLNTFQDCWRSWNFYFSLATPDGEEVCKQFFPWMPPKERAELEAVHQRVPGEEIQNVGSTSSSPTGDAENENDKSERHYSVAVGGTFDHLHIGHKLLLSAVALALDPTPFEDPYSPLRRITIGVMDDDLLMNKQYAEVLEPWETRAKAVLNFLLSIIDFQPPWLNLTNECSAATDYQDALSFCVPNTPKVPYMVASLSRLMISVERLHDGFGPTLTDPDISALVVSRETRNGGQAVNDERRAKGWREMKLLEVDVVSQGEDEKENAAPAEVKNEAFASKISSTEIRRRIMNA